MARCVNQVTLIGHVCFDPEIRTVGSGSQLVKLRVATNERRKVGEEWKEFAEYHNVVCFGYLSKRAVENVAKGTQVYVDGRLETRKWTDKSGNERWTTSVVAKELIALGEKVAQKAADQVPDVPDDDLPY